MPISTSYFGVAVTNPRERSFVNCFAARIFDPRSEPEALNEIVKRALEPEKICKIRDELIAPESIELAEGNQRTFLARFGLYPAIERWLLELSQDGLAKAEIKQKLACCLQGALEDLEREPYQVAPKPLPFVGLGRIDPAIVKDLLKAPCGDLGAEHSDSRAPSGFVRVDRGEDLKVSLLQGETKHLILRVRHAGPCVVPVQHFAIVDGERIEVDRWNLIATEGR